MRLSWSSAMERIEGRINRQSFNTWFRQIHFRGLQDDTLRLAVPSKFHLDWICDHYLGYISETLDRVHGQHVNLSLEVAPELAVQPAAEETADEPPAPAASTSASASDAGERHRFLNPRYTFDRFVTGPSNQFARAACMAVAEKPARAYNPLFVYGGVGLGKTHLLHAIGLQMLERDPTTKIIYVSTEEFMNDLIDSVRHERMNAFRQRYRSQCDVLLVDDIQFLAGKDRTQEEFFHTFNFLFESQRQIVITSDRFPHEMPGIEERLRTRFQCGLIADIQPPEIETRIAILQTKAEGDAIELPSEVALFLATNIKSNVRELEGSLIRLQAFASLSNKSIDLQLARERLKGLLSDGEQMVGSEQILKLVANYFGVKVSDLKGSRRQRTITVPRQVAMYLCRKHCHLSFPEIGERFGGKDHTTVIAAVRKIESCLAHNKDINKAITAVENSFISND